MDHAPLLDLIADLHDGIDLIDTTERLSSMLEAICRIAGLRYFAIMHHIDFRDPHAEGLHLHNYPPALARHHDEQGLGLSDPVHRACQVRGTGFQWARLPSLLTLSPSDILQLEHGERAGLGDGYTVPVHLPGEHSGSCSFATGGGIGLDHRTIPLIQSLGSFAFEAARRLRARQQDLIPRARLTEREREIVKWLGRGKQEKQIAQILGIGVRTVNDHLKHARTRLGLHKSSLLIVHELLVGSITYNDLLSWQ